jgi:hypothetical protein
MPPFYIHAAFLFFFEPAEAVALQDDEKMMEAAFYSFLRLISSLASPSKPLFSHVDITKSLMSIRLPEPSRSLATSTCRREQAR